jgi:hypothetical protein
MARRFNLTRWTCSSFSDQPATTRARMIEFDRELRSPSFSGSSYRRSGPRQAASAEATAGAAPSDQMLKDEAGRSLSTSQRDNLKNNTTYIVPTPFCRDRVCTLSRRYRKES